MIVFYKKNNLYYLFKIVLELFELKRTAKKNIFLYKDLQI